MSSTASSNKSSLVVEEYEKINDSADAASDQDEPSESRRPSFPEGVADRLCSARPKKSLAEVAQSDQRYVKGGSAMPSPLNFGPSLLDILKEGPPEDNDQPIVMSPTSLQQSPTADSTPPTPTIGTPKKGRKLAKASLSAVRRLITPKHKQFESMRDPVETASPTSPGHVPDNPGSDGRETATTTSPASPTPLGKIYGQPPAYKIRPEHLRLSSFPPVPREELAKLPRDLEPTLPSGQVSPLGFGHQSQSTSLRNATKVNDAGVEVPVYTECEECEEAVPTSWVGICPVKGCRLVACKNCKVQPWEATRFSITTSKSHCTPIHRRIAYLTADMRTFEDTFSGEKIYPGKGKIYVRGDSKIFRFQNGKTESLFLQRKNPRRIAWTTLYRRQHKKGISEEVAKKRTRRTVKQQRGIVGASLDIIKERRSQRPEARAAARQEAIKAGKEKKATAESKKKMEKAKSAAGAARGQTRGGIQSKQGAKGAPSKATGKVR
ncbi:MAG: hypothetical protein Q9184_006381 [Pyrenodesmia sp. 2 TL-2023]